MFGYGRISMGTGRRAGKAALREEAALRPARRSLLPRRATLLRATLVTALITMAAGVLWLPAPATPTGTAPQDGRPTAGDTRPDRSTTRNAEPGQSTTGNAEPGQSTATGRPRQSAPVARPTPPAGTVGVPVRITEPAALAVLRPGAQVDLMVVPAAGGQSPAPVVVAADALVLAVVDAAGRVHAGDGGDLDAGGALVAGDPLDGAGALYLALPPDQAHRVVAAPPDARFAVVIRS